MFLILFSAKNNKTNRWCAITTFIGSLGTFKEYMYDSLAPNLNVIDVTLVFNIHSVLTAILYYLAMPCSVIAALYFSGFPYKNNKQFQVIRCILFIPPIMLSLLFNPLETKTLQLTSRLYWYIVTSYNITLGLLMTTLIILTVVNEKFPPLKKQKKLIGILVLPPVWYWLITIFIIHCFQLQSLYKLWQENIFILLVLLLFYFIAAYTEGIMGLKIQLDNYNWDADMKIINKGAMYTSHMLKNEVTKIEWCIKNITEKLSDAPPEELAIIQRSTEHLKQYLNKTKIYSGNITLKKSKIAIDKLIENVRLLLPKDMYKSIHIVIKNIPNDFIYCDIEHITEVLYNLLINAADSMDNTGTITINCEKNVKKGMYIITITDEGKGIPRKYLHNIFQPYFTTKKSNENYGLGLSYCFHVLMKHKGYIDLKTKEGKGTTFYLYVPI
jgi:signal transduction histidine kinase